MSESKKTPLWKLHEELGAKMVDFAGFRMPVAYGSIIEEHNAVRERVGIFDVSHMGEFLVSGPRARELVNEVITNDLSRIGPGQLQYSVMCRENGGVVDDLLVFLLADDEVLMVVNAANVAKDFEHVRSFERPGAAVRNVSDSYALVAVQGPLSLDLLEACPFFAKALAELRSVDYYAGFGFDHDGDRILVSRTGYTGERGFEIFVPPARAAALWREITETGAKLGLQPIGLGARDTLRFEASFCLYGNELDEDTSPLEAGLGWVVRLGKDHFNGIEALRAEKERGPERTLVGFELEGRNIARHGYAVLNDGEVVGKVTSGAFSPTLQKSLCMAFVKRAARSDVAEYQIEIRGKQVPARLSRLPFYKSRAK